MEKKVGDKIVIEIVAQKGCNGCFFDNKNGDCDIPEGMDDCSGDVREDSTSIIFKLIE